MFVMHRLRIFLAGLALSSCFGSEGTLAADSTFSPVHFKASFSERLRIETTDNATYLDNDALQGSSYLRIRSSLGLQTLLPSRWQVVTRLTNEFRNYTVAETRQFNLDEIFFDQLYIRGDSLGGKPLSLIVGRQNIMLGEGFVLFEGGPGDGSRSAYFNAAQAIWSFRPKNSLALIYVNQPRTDNVLPLIHDQHRVMVEQPEQGIAAYYSGFLRSVNLQGYVIHKRISPNGTIHGSKVNCAGMRLQIPLASQFTATSEVAGQLGSWGEVDQHAFGGYGYVEYKTGWPVYFPKSFAVGGIYLSGDDPSTTDYEGWEPMFGRWPKWSESYIYTLARESRVAYWTNLASFFLRTAVPLGSDITAYGEYYHLMAPQHGDGSTAFPGGRGKERGDLLIGKIMYQIAPRMAGHLIWEHLIPGNFYFGGANKSSWIRMEMLLTF